MVMHECEPPWGRKITEQRRVIPSRYPSYVRVLLRRARNNPVPEDGLVRGGMEETPLLVEGTEPVDWTTSLKKVNKRTNEHLPVPRSVTPEMIVAALGRSFDHKAE